MCLIKDGIFLELPAPVGCWIVPHQSSNFNQIHWLWGYVPLSTACQFCCFKHKWSYAALSWNGHSFLDRPGAAPSISFRTPLNPGWSPGFIVTVEWKKCQTLTDYVAPYGFSMWTHVLCVRYVIISIQIHDTVHIPFNTIVVSQNIRHTVAPYDGNLANGLSRPFLLLLFLICC